MTKKSPFDLSFEEMAAIGERAFAEAKRETVATGLPNPYINVESRARYLKKIAQGGLQNNRSKDEAAARSADFLYDDDGLPE
ncbi:hypothetical protein [Kordiimonas sp.]|uniref:hypothetical protein n=1 Tax=Kordiimonas sp. TaxID=1970157 RepID=UPI003A91088B